MLVLGVSSDLRLFQFLEGRRADDFRWTNEQIESHIFKHQKPWIAFSVDSQFASIVLYNQWDQVIEINYLETAGPFIRQGYMKALLTAFFEKEPSLSCWLDVHEGNLAARNLYQSLGFLTSGLRKGYYRDGSNGLQLTRPSGLSTL